jgi:hypothetical protein
MWRSFLFLSLCFGNFDHLSFCSPKVCVISKVGFHAVARLRRTFGCEVQGGFAGDSLGKPLLDRT